MKKNNIQDSKDDQKLSINEAIFQVVFLINNNRFESALEVVETNNISLGELSENKSITCLEDFRSYIKTML